MIELVANFHMHTPYSDGFGSHATIAKAAIRTGLDVVITTDHNVYVKGLDGYHVENEKKVLLMVGEEVHDVLREPQKNHLLIFGAGRELATYASNPQRLIDQANQAGGLAFIAHPIDPAMEAFNEPDLSWENWEVRGYTGIELWNGFSELKVVAHNHLQGLFYAYFPQFIAHGPIPATLRRWDDLLRQGQKVVAIGGADAHAISMRLGPLSRVLFPYDFHFRAINTHVLTPNPLSLNLFSDRQMVLDALRQGHAFVGYDLPASTRGFNFTARGRNQTGFMGDEVPLDDGVTFQIRLPLATECRLLQDGQPIKAWNDKENITYITNQPGVFRVECYINYLGKRRGWIFSNPIYVRAR
jgi:hypothetical protein